MSYTALLEKIKQGTVSPVYLLYGEETFFVRKIEEAIINAVVAPENRDLNLIMYERDPEMAELVSVIETVPFMGGNNLIVVRDTALFRPGRKTSEDNQEDPGGHDSSIQRLISIIEDFPPYSHLVLIAGDKVDKRRKLFKLIEKVGTIFAAEPLKAKDVRGWVTNKMAEMNKRLSPDALDHLLAVTSIMPQVSLAFLNGELEKLVLYVRERTVITKDDLTAVLSSVPEVSAFALMDAIILKQTSKALHLLTEQLAAGDHPLRIIALLARQVRMLWQAKEWTNVGYNPRSIAEKLGVPPFVGEKLVSQGANFTNAQLKQTVLAIASADRDLKSSRTTNVVLERIIIELCS